MTSAFLSRIRLRRDAPAAAIAPLLLPEETSQRSAAAHRLLWTLFADEPDRKRDYLWREAEGGDAALNQRFLALSAREPVDRHDLFELDTKPFAPALTAGDRLGFTLRANPVVSRATAERGRRGQRHDIVMDRLKSVPSGERAAARPAIVMEAGRNWLTRQGEQHGFTLQDDGFQADGYRQLRIPRGPKAKPMMISVLDLTGVIEIREPDRFLAALHQGFGKAKAFGCGLMLIRRL